MTEFQPSNSEPSNEGGLAPGSMEEAFIADGVRRTLGDTWNPEDPDWKEAYEAHRMLMEAGLTEPAVNLDKIREIIAVKAMGGQETEPLQHTDNDEDTEPN